MCVHVHIYDFMNIHTHAYFLLVNDTSHTEENLDSGGRVHVILQSASHLRVGFSVQFNILSTIGSERWTKQIVSSRGETTPVVSLWPSARWRRSERYERRRNTGTERAAKTMLAADAPQQEREMKSAHSRERHKTCILPNFFAFFQSFVLLRIKIIGLLVLTVWLF